MSDSMQPPVPRPPRAERMTTSCGECRRRKQKCNQGQPCSNCARRFPPPVCEYKQRRPHPIPSQSQRPIYSFPSYQPPPFPVNPVNQGFNSAISQHSPLPAPQISPVPAQWGHRNSTDLTNAFLQWPGLSVPSPQPSTPVSPPPAGHYAWNTSQDTLSMCILPCREGCTEHSTQVHEAITMLRAYRPVPNIPSGASWNPSNFTWSFGPIPSGSGGISWPTASPVHQFSNQLPRLLMGDAELLSVYFKYISQFTASLDGNPDASSPYLKYYVPFCEQSELMQHMAICWAACFLSDTGHVERPFAQSHKDRVIQLLNRQLLVSASDEMIAAVLQLIVVEWLWGSAELLQTHRNCLQQLILTRGGLNTLGLHGLISKHAVTTDVAIALSFENEPTLRGSPVFDFDDNTQAPFRVTQNTPFDFSSIAFAQWAPAHPARIAEPVASILEDIRTLLKAVHKSLENPYDLKELQRVRSTALFVQERLNKAPTDIITGHRPSATLSPGTPSPGSTNIPSPSLQPHRTSASRSRTPQPAAPPLTQQPLPGAPGISLTAPQPIRQPILPGPQQPDWRGPDFSQTLSPHLQPPSPLPSISPVPSPILSSTSVSSGIAVVSPSPSSPAPPPPLSPSPGPTTPSSVSNGPTEQDYIYQVVRQAALLYTKAIIARKPFSQVVTAEEFQNLWTTAWHVPLSTWRSLLGVFNWILLPISCRGKQAFGSTPAGRDVNSEGAVDPSLSGQGQSQAQGQEGSKRKGKEKSQGVGISTPHDRYVKGMLNLTLLQMAMENWAIAKKIMEGEIALQRWLANKSEAESFMSGAASGQGWEGAGEDSSVLQQAGMAVSGEDKGKRRFS